MSKKTDDFRKELDEITPALIARAKGRCEARIPGVCLGHPDGFAFTMSRHHRLPRSHGGTSDLSNLAYLCGTGTTGCHGFIEHNRREAYARGFLLRTGLDPRLVAMVAPWRK